MLNLKNYTRTLIFLPLLNSNGTSKTDGWCKKTPRKYTKLPHTEKKNDERGDLGLDGKIMQKITCELQTSSEG